MSKPNNSISKIKLPGESTGRPIVPYALSSANGSYQFTTPDPSPAADGEVLVTNAFQVITSYKLFSNNSVGFNTSSSYGDGSISYHVGGPTNNSTESLRLYFHDPAYEYQTDLGNRGWSFDVRSSGHESTIAHINTNYFYIDSDAIKFGGTKDGYGWETNVKTLLFPTMTNGTTKTIATVDQIPAPSTIPIEDLTSLAS